jgi:hypothetical protein
MSEERDDEEELLIDGHWLPEMEELAEVLNDLAQSDVPLHNVP